MNKDIKKMEKDYKDAVLDSIGISKETGDTHFIFKKGNKYFGIGVKNFETYYYTEREK